MGRLRIEDLRMIRVMLDKQASLTSITQCVSASRNTVSTEISLHRLPLEVVTPIQQKGFVPRIGLWYSGTPYSCLRDCLALNPCKKMIRFPLCCNGCISLNSCPYPKVVYDEYLAWIIRRETSGITRVRSEVDDATRQYVLHVLQQEQQSGKSKAQIIREHADDFPISRASVYRLWDREMYLLPIIDELLSRNREP